MRRETVDEKQQCKKADVKVEDAAFSTPKSPDVALLDLPGVKISTPSRIQLYSNTSTRSPKSPRLLASLCRLFLSPSHDIATRSSANHWILQP